MGREIKRVPMDFAFPDESFHDARYQEHCAVCPNTGEDAHDECDIDYAPPKGDGWQLWQTVSDGPTSPVFATADALIDWMCQPDPVAREWRSPPVIPYPSNPWGQGWKREIAEPFVKGIGWAPSFVFSGRGLEDGPSFVVNEAKAKAAR